MNTKPPLVRILLAVLVISSLLGCGSADDDHLSTRPGESVLSPSGKYTATFLLGAPMPGDNGIDVYHAVILDADGREVFRDENRLASNFGRAVVWLSTAEHQLWILSKDTGTAHVDLNQDGTWVFTGITPETIDTIPKEIEDLE